MGPPLPMPIFTSLEVWRPERIRSLALYCSDGRWGEAFDDFCHRRLLIPRYDRWAVPGGPAWLTVETTHPELYEAAHSQLDFLVRAHQLERIILITHYGCAYYTEQFHREADDSLGIQMRDVSVAARVLGSWFPSLRVEGYLAMRQGNQLTFHGLDLAREVPHEPRLSGSDRPAP